MARPNSNWVDGAHTRLYLSQHYEAWDPRFLERYDLAELIRICDATEPDLMLATARTHNGFWFCDVGWGEHHPRLGGVDQLEALIRHFHAKGKPVIAYFSTVYDKALYDMHPEWRQVDPQGLPVSGIGRSWGKVVCLNSPYREYLQAMIRQLLATHDLDGVFFDMTFFEPRPCYCGSCRRLFREKYGAELPEKEDWDDPLYRKFVQFRLDSNFTFVKETCDAVKAVNPALTTSVQYPLMNGPSPYGRGLDIAQVPDYLYLDVYFRSGYLRRNVCTRLVASLSRHVPELSIVTRPGSHNDAPNMKSLDHLRADAFGVIANGGALQFFDIMWGDGTLQEPMWERVRQVFAEVRAREPWLGGTPTADVSVFYSEKSRLWYGRADAGDRYDANFFGVCRALIEEHIPYNVVTSLDQATLEGCLTLVLPNAACMSEAEAAAVRTYVRQGGGLVCTDRTSLFDETGAALADYRLADLLGATRVGDTGAYSRAYSRYDTSSPVAARLPADGLVTSWGTVQKLALKGGQALARVAYPYTEPTGERFVNIMANPPAVASTWPACVLNGYGKGRVVYFPSAIDRDYLRLSFPELKWLLVDAARHVMRGGPFIELKAPISVEVTAYRRQEGKQLVVHLLNFQPENGRDIVSPDYTTRHLIQEILPVRDLELTVRMDGVRKATLQPEGQALAFRRSGDRVEITVPQVLCHSMVVLEG
jgi:hypothetical protein